MVSDDIVTRLRDSRGMTTCRSDDGFLSIVPDTMLMQEAADEIERLRAEVSRLRQIIVDASPDDDYFLVRKEADAIWEIAHDWKMPSE